MKKNRHQKLKELVEQYEIETQDELAEKLKEAGFDVTQATVSRDIRELKLTKVPTGNGRQKYTILVHSDHYLSDKYIRVLKDGYVSMDVAQNILVVKTVSGMAMAVAAAIDAIKLKEIVGYLGEHFTEPLSLSAVAAEFGLSPQYFSTFFRDNFGRTFTQHINSLRIEQASRLLRETDLPVIEVGFRVGFDNFSYFIKRFRLVYGVSPSHYRKNSLT